MRRAALLLATVLAACEGTPASSPIADAAVPDAARTGPPALTLSRPTLTLREGAAPARLTVTIEGELPGPVAVTLQGDVASVRPDRLVFRPDGPRAVEVEVAAPFDDDEAAGSGALRIEAEGLPPAVVPVTVTDAQLTIVLDLDAQQREFVRTSNDTERRLLVPTRIGGRPGPGADINLRGKGTLRCPRRSYTVRFDDPVVLGDGPPVEDVYLLSMCLDEGFIKMRAANDLLAAQGLFPLFYRYVEVRYGDETQGVYLVVERPRDGVKRVHRQNSLLVRRLNDSTVELKRPEEDEVTDREAVLAPYLALYDLPRTLRGANLLDALRSSMNYDAYLRWLAVNSLVQNGDYVDEVYFYDAPPPDGGRQPWFEVLAWDYDDMLSNCHTPRPLDEPLLYCAESGLDRPVRDVPEVRAAYIEQLRAAMEGPMSEAAVAGALANAAAELEMYLRRPGVAAVMYGADAGTPSPAADAEALRALAAERRAELEALLP